MPLISWAKRCFILVGLLSLWFCNRPKDYSASIIEKQQRADEMDSILKYWQTMYVDNPDSAVLYAQFIISYCDSFELLQQKFSAYLMIAELAQYNKQDEALFFKSMLGAAELFYSNEIVAFLDPYSLINFGNLFYHLNINKQAIDYYKGAVTVALKNNCQHAEALAYQNIALAYAAQSENDSSLYYFNKCETASPDELRTVYIQNKTHIAQYYYDIGIKDSASYYAKECMRLLDNYKAKRPEMQEEALNAHSLAWHKMYIRTHLLLMKINAEDQHTIAVNFHFDQALALTNKLPETSALKAWLYYQMASYNQLSKQPSPMLEQASLALSFAQESLQYDLAIQSASILKDYYSKQNDIKMCAYFSNLMLGMHDKIQESDKIKNEISSLIYLATVGHEKEKRELLKNKIEKQVIIKHQRLYIFLLGLLFISSMIFSIVVFIQRRKITSVYTAVAESVTDKIKEEELESIQENEVNNELLERLDKLMKTEKVYQDKNLNLDSLSRLLNTNQTYTSQLINQQHGTNFNDYINRLRTKEVCRLMTLSECEKCALPELADRAGFASKSTLYAAFKKHVGMTPSAFRNRLGK